MPLDQFKRVIEWANEIKNLLKRLVEAAETFVGKEEPPVEDEE